ncbi:MAG: M20/M25/M40 family metallo-hydrolase [bacterium]|jgi:arginine utilization protein RocB
MSWNTPEKIKEIMLRMVACSSISGTTQEVAMEKEIHAILAEIPYFQKHPDYLQLNPIPGDAQGRYFVTGLVRGKSPKTVILLNHHDIAGLSDYGAYAELALDPVRLTKEIDPSILTPEARKDWETGDWLFGRGVMDMKCGGALQIALLEETSEIAAEFEGTLLFLSVPDEENNSAGMLGAVPRLNRMKEEFGLDYAAVVNSEPADVTPDGKFNVFTGAIGKVLPMFYCVGKETHAGSSLGGINSNLLYAEIQKLLEVNADLADMADGEASAPPTNLKTKDMKELYNVSTPSATVAYYNVFSLTRSPKEIMDKLIELAKQAFANALAKQKREAKRYSEITGLAEPAVPWEPKVYTYREVYDMAFAAHGEKFAQHMQEYTEKWKQRSDIDEREFTLQIVAEVHRYCPDRNPMIIIAYAPPYYPHFRNKGETPKEKKLLAMVEALEEFASERFGVHFQVNRFHKGISDLSYCGLQNAEDVIEMLRPNMPTWGYRYSLPLEELRQLDLAVFNVGSFGRDAHKYTERLNMPFSFNISPHLLKFAVIELLK